MKPTYKRILNPLVPWMFSALMWTYIATTPTHYETSDVLGYALHIFACVLAVALWCISCLCACSIYLKAKGIIE